MNTSLKGVVVVAVAPVASASEFRGVLRERFLLGSDILVSLLMVYWRLVAGFSLSRSVVVCPNSPRSRRAAL